ncbi:hypothetical protein F8388_020374 [Cannabis sativa]|uniref:CCHC-type domain-containing protein n=1 Tax=Cannabis sativa TaxID=3483 RepID=A0A7J6HIX5_CANSA|nr:hypothetical protein G4B88_005653 [Cannabis sativa]KAF4394549.1 hypothetical protein F8388_020374 [Cannabis sativa]
MAAINDVSRLEYFKLLSDLSPIVCCHQGEEGGGLSVWENDWAWRVKIVELGFEGKRWEQMSTMEMKREGSGVVNDGGSTMERKRGKRSRRQCRVDNGGSKMAGSLELFCLRSGDSKIGNSFEFGFEDVETPSLNDRVEFKLLRLWMQIHNLPHEYFSMANGNLLGNLARKVVRVDLEDHKPSSWCKFMKVQVDIDFAKPLTSGCYFDLASSEKRWIQFKFEKIGIFCYKCGVLGHQRRGCKLFSPVIVVNSVGTPFPIFGPWLSTVSAYLDVFSRIISGFGRGALASAPGKSFRVGAPLMVVDGKAGVRPYGLARRPRRSTCGSQRAGLECSVQAITNSGNKGEFGNLRDRKAPEKGPVLAINGDDRASLSVLSLNNGKEVGSIIGIGPNMCGPSENSNEPLTTS